MDDENLLLLWVINHKLEEKKEVNHCNYYLEIRELRVLSDPDPQLSIRDDKNLFDQH
jgi:hypothetical protein